MTIFPSIVERSATCAAAHMTPGPPVPADDALSIPPGLEPFDGVVCFGGEDWWYHNRGHFDFQMMRELKAAAPVLYVNSLGMRIPRPREGRMFLSRVRRKLRSIRRGLVCEQPGMSIYSPVAVPGRLGMWLTRGMLVRGVRRAQRRLGMHRPLVWVACPTAAAAVDALDPAIVVYQRTDRYECFSDVDADQITQYDAWLKARADLTVFCSRHLFEREAAQCAAPLSLDHGIAAERFIRAAAGDAPPPADLDGIARPRVGFIGGIDAHTFDPELFKNVSRRMPDVQFVMVGASSLPAGWCALDNVHWLGQRPFESVPDYMAACDALIMPWRRSEWIEACNPVKLKEYLATGRPVVSVDFPELRRYGALVRTANDAEGFAACIRESIDDPGDAAARQDAVRGQTWRVQARSVLEALVPPKTELPAPESIRAADDQPDPVRAPVRTAVEYGSGPPLDLAACIVLATTLRPSFLQRQSARCVLELWLCPDRTVLQSWLDRFTEFERSTGSRPDIRVVRDEHAVDHTELPPHARLSVEPEPRPLRGPAGTIADLCRDIAPERHVLVVEAARFAAVSLLPLIHQHQARDADVTIASNPDGAPAGAYLIRRRTLDRVPPRGFVDLKEQWLPRSRAEGARVFVHRLDAPGLCSLRSRQEFLDATVAAGAPAPAVSDMDARCDVRPVGRSSGATVVCPGAFIGPGATVIDSVLMPGAVVHGGALVVRSIICPHGTVESGERVIDDVVGASVGNSEVQPACA